MSLLSLCWHNKTSLPAKLPQCLVSQLATSCNISWGFVIQDCRDMVSYHLPCHRGASPQTARRRSHQVPIDSLIWRGICLPGKLGTGPWMYNRTQWGTGTSEGRGTWLIRLVRTQVWIQACLRRQKGRLITSQRPLVTTSNHGETMSLRFWEQGGSTVLCESVWKWEPETQPSCEVSEESWSSVPWQNHNVKGEP
jgi:hypothetical protein